MKQKKFLNDLAFVYAGAVTNGLSLFLINVLLGRNLDKDIFAVFSLSIMVLSTVAEMSDLGLNGGLLRFAPHYLAVGAENKLKQLIKTIWNWRIYISAILTVGGILLSYPLAKYVFGQPQIYKQITFSFLGVGGVVLLGFASTFMQASQKFVANSVFQILKGVLRLLLVVVMVFLGVTNIYYYLLVYIGIPWFLFLFAYKFLPAGFNQAQLSPEETKALSKQLAGFSFWLAVWSFAAIISSRIDQIFISRLLGLKDVANYYVAYQFVFLFSMASQSITSILMPKINSITDKEQLKVFIKRAYKWIIAGIIILAPLVYPSKFIIVWLFGMKYAEAMPVYLVLSFGVMLSFLCIPLGLLITYFNKTQLYAIFTLSGVGISVVSNHFFISNFGVIGAAYSYIVYMLLAVAFNLVCGFYLYKTKNINIV